MICDLNDKKNCVIILCYNYEKDAQKIKDNTLSLFQNSNIGTARTGAII